jgi:hypothetical protein
MVAPLLDTGQSDAAESSAAPPRRGGASVREKETCAGIRQQSQARKFKEHSAKFSAQAPAIRDGRWIYALAQHHFPNCIDFELLFFVPLSFFHLFSLDSASSTVYL